MCKTTVNVQIQFTDTVQGQPNWCRLLASTPQRDFFMYDFSSNFVVGKLSPASMALMALECKRHHVIEQ
jgi:hypothetical protein